MTKRKQKLNAFLSTSSKLAKENADVIKTIAKVLKNQGYHITWEWFRKNKNNEINIYKKAIEAIKKSDLIIAEISIPSTGVGQQIALAYSWNIPVLCLYNKKISAKEQKSKFTLGNQNNLITTKSYDLKNIDIVVRNSINFIKKEKFTKFNFISTPELNTYLNFESEKNDMSKSQYLRHIIRNYMQKQH